MQNLKQIVLKLPEYLLIVAVIFYWGSAGRAFNPIAIALVIVLILQIIYKNRVIGLLIPGFLILSCLYMLMALLSEFNEFNTFNTAAKKLLFVGLTYFISTMIVAGIMIYNYSTTKNRPQGA